MELTAFKVISTLKGLTSLVVQWLRLCTSTAGDAALIPSQGTQIPTCHAVQPTQKIKNKNEAI